MTTAPLKAPFPWFGGKSRAAELVWDAFGDVANYVEPFAGSLAVLLNRPTPPRVETVNDLDCYLANFWRALAREPGAVAEHADWPVNEADLHARHRWLVAQDDFRTRMRADPDFYDAKVAGWWVWGISQWIGSGWCASPEWEGRAHAGAAARGIHARRARDMSAAHNHEKRPALGNGGRGVHRTGLEVWEQKPDTSGSRGAAGRGVHAGGLRATGVLEWFEALAARLRHVRVCCGDWGRILTPATTTQIGVTGVLLDPPYAHDAGRDPSIYAHESADVSHRVREWAIENGENPGLRIALCGYEGEHVLPANWRCVEWKAAGGYARDNQENAQRERIWFSPHCLKPERLRQTSLLEKLEGQP